MAKIATKSTREDLTGVDFAFTDGETISFDLASVSPEMVTHLALHGFSQKGGDSYSGESDLEVAKAKVRGVIERLIAGDWKAVREAGGGRISDLARALAEVMGKDIAEAVEAIEPLDRGQKTALRAHPQIAAKLAEYSAARAAEKAAKAAEEGAELPDLSALGL